MKINGTDISVERNGITTENSFSIKATGKAFRILSDGLYSNKIQAVIRELSCNAYDAHIAAGKPNEPIYIHLPNRIEPWFAVQDFGIGLSQQDVTQLYSTYFESTKNTSNDFVGAFGLGSKSPFSYVDSFTIISIFNGVKSTYAAFIGEEEVPCIALLGSEETTETNGVTVQMPVKDFDMNNFHNEAKNIFRFFDTTPRFNIPDFTIDKNIPAFSGTNWRYYSSTIEYSYGVKIIQGNVAYKLDRSFITSQLKDEMPVFRQIEDMLNTLKMDIIVPIGTVDVAASREALSFNKQTINALKEILPAVYEELKLEVINYVQSLATSHSWDDLLKLKNFRKNNYDIIRLFQSIPEIYETKSIINVDLQSNPDFKFLRKNDGSKVFHRFDECLADIKETAFEVNDYTYFFYSDKTVPETWLRKYFKDLNKEFRSQNIVIIDPSISLDKAFSILGYPDIIKTSDLTKPERIKRVTKDAITFKITSSTYGGFRFEGEHHFSGELPQGGYYVETASRNIVIKTIKDGQPATYTLKLNEIMKHLAIAADQKLFDIDKEETIWVFNQTQIKAIKDDANWVNLVDLVRENLKTVLDDAQELFLSKRMFSFHARIYTGDNTRNLSQIATSDRFKEIEKTTMGDYLTMFMNYKNIETNDKAQTLADNLCVFLDNTETDQENILDNLNINVSKQYPLLKYILGETKYKTFTAEQINEFIDYVKTVEKVLTISETDIKLVSNNRS